MESSLEGASECNCREAECRQEWSSYWPYPNKEWYPYLEGDSYRPYPSSAPDGLAWGWARGSGWTELRPKPRDEPGPQLGQRARRRTFQLGSLGRGFVRGSGRGFWARRESSLGCLGWGCRWCCDRSRRFARTSRLPNKDGTPRRSNGVERRWNGAAPWHVSSRVARARATRLMKEVISGHPDSSAAILRSHQ